jgi:L-2-hydroxyglutarate oxidase LhgO
MFLNIKGIISSTITASTISSSSIKTSTLKLPPNIFSTSTSSPSNFLLTSNFTMAPISLQAPVAEALLVQDAGAVKLSAPVETIKEQLHKAVHDQTYAVKQTEMHAKTVINTAAAPEDTATAC